MSLLSRLHWPSFMPTRRDCVRASARVHRRAPVERVRGGVGWFGLLLCMVDVIQVIPVGIDIGIDFYGIELLV